MIFEKDKKIINFYKKNIIHHFILSFGKVNNIFKNFQAIIIFAKSLDINHISFHLKNSIVVVWYGFYVTTPYWIV